MVAEEVSVNGVKAEAELLGGCLRWREKDKKEEKQLNLGRDVLGVRRMGKNVSIEIVSKAAEEIRGRGSKARLVRKEFVLAAGTEGAAEAWREGIQTCIDLLGRPKRLFILVNPYGGKKEAPLIFKNEVQPLLDAAGISYSVRETQYQLHAQELMAELDLKSYDGIVCVSGDGLLAEVVNGLLQRQDWPEAIKIPLGIIPGGTGNGMSKSLLDDGGESFSASNATLSIIRGSTRKLDVSTVAQGGNKFFSVLMLAWGLVADVDIESEKYRWMGAARIDFYVLLRVLRLRRYEGRVHFVPAPGYDSIGVRSTAEMEFCMNKKDSSEEKKGYQGPSVSFKSSEWRSLEGPFILLWIHNVPWGSAGSIPAPDAKFSDGYLDVLIIKDCSRRTLFSVLASVGDGSHVNYPCAIYLKVKAFRLEPGQRVNEPGKGGIIDVDGEVLARGSGTYQSEKSKDLMKYGPPIQLTVDQGLATIFAPSECKPSF